MAIIDRSSDVSLQFVGDYSVYCMCQHIT